MSAQPVNRVVEWSPNEVVAYDAATRQYVRAADFDQLAKTVAGGPIVAAISRRTAFVKAVRVPNASAAEIDLILQTQMATMFPVPLSELSYSFRLTPDVNQDGRLAVVAAMRESDLQTMHLAAKSAGFKVERTVPAALGSMLLGETLGYKDLAVVQDWSEGLAIDLLAGGELRYSRVAAMPANADLLESEITRSFQAVGLPCAPTLAAGGIAMADAEYRSPSPTLELLVGSALDRLGINIETRETREKRERARSANRNRLALLLCAAAALLALLVFLDWSDASEAVRQSEAKWKRGLSGKRTDAQRIESEVAKLRATEDTLNRAFYPAQSISDILTTVSNHAPTGVWLTGVTLERGKLMYLRGTSTNSEAVANFLQALNAEIRLRDVKLVFANNGEIDKRPVVQFAIQAFPVGNLPLIDPKKKAARK
jgi:Tfp pilus assembly protein PilN